MTVVRSDACRRSPELPRLDLVVTPRWLRERRRALSRAAHPAALAAEVADEVLRRSLPGREMTFSEIMRAQGVTPFDAEKHPRTLAEPTEEEWAAFHAALTETHEQ